MIEWNLKRTVSPPDMPVSVSEVKEQTRVDLSAEDALLERLIKAATNYVEGPYGIGVVMVEQTWELTLDRFMLPGIDIPLYPLLSVEAIDYIDQAGNEQTLSTDVYRVDTHSNPARIRLEWNQSWPSTRLISNAVTVTFKAGYKPDGSDYRANIPEDLRHVIMLLVSHWYENRAPVNVGDSVTNLPMAVQAILDRYRVPGIA